MKVLSYSLFGDSNSFEFPFYLRGIYFNARMNRLLYPDWITFVHVDQKVFFKHQDLIERLAVFGVRLNFHDHKDRCLSMLWRMRNLFSEGVTHVLCRDADSVSTYREALCVYEWLNSGLPFHAINDNNAHSGLMGGMVGFKSKEFKDATGYTSFDQMISGQKLSKHGSDQDFMNREILPKIWEKLLFHKLKGAGSHAHTIKTEVPEKGPIDKKLWVSDLISRYIGSAGVIDIELLRFFKSFDPDPKFDEFERKYPEIFYWAR